MGDEKHCNLEDDDSFEEQKGGRNTELRKSSINITPKSRVIEPGKIFNSRQMTPSSQAVGKRKEGGSMISSAFAPRKSAGGATNFRTSHKYSNSNLIIGANTPKSNFAGKAEGV